MNFIKVIDNILKSIKLIQRDHINNLNPIKRNFSDKLGSNLTDWYSFHFQSIQRNKGKADLRIVYKQIENGHFKILGFGDRHNPDIYKKLSKRKIEIPFFYD